jgi:DNA-binding CsgD family transcriptional regulator
MDPEQVQVLQDKLDAIIRLLAHDIMGDFETQREKIAFLNDLGLGPKRIAEILNTTPNTVRVTLSQMRKRSKQTNTDLERDTT